MRSALDEYATGYKVKNKMSQTTYSPYFDKGLILMTDLAKNSTHYTKTTNRWADWAKEARLQVKGEGPKTSVTDEDMGIILD